MKSTLLLAFSLVLLTSTPSFAGTKAATGGSPSASTSSQMSEVEPGVYMYKTVYTGENGAPTNLWVYLPKARTGDVPCVVIAAAGAPVFAGSTLGEGDQPEHIPYVKAGFAVVAYETDGPYKDDSGFEGVVASARKFKAVDAGIKNGRSAVEYASRLSGIKESCIFAAGHSSAGSIALRVAQVDPRVKACVAYAPAVATTERMDDMAKVNSLIPGFTQYMTSRQPMTFAPLLRVPTFVFNAADDTVVGKHEIERFVKIAETAKRPVMSKTVASGGHYDSMISEGVPAGIAFLKKQPCCASK